MHLHRPARLTNFCPVRSAAAAVWFAAALASPGALVRVEFTASQVTISATPFGLTDANRTELATGYFTYDRTTTDINPDPGVGEYPHILGDPGFVVTLSNGVVISGSLTPFVTVTDGVSGDGFQMIDGPRPVGDEGGVMAQDGAPDPGIQLNLAMTADANVFTSDDLPRPFPLVNAYDGFLDPPHTFSLRDSDGEIVLLQFTEVIPEPGTAALLVLGVGMLLGRRARPRQAG